MKCKLKETNDYECIYLDGKNHNEVTNFFNDDVNFLFKLDNGNRNIMKNATDRGGNIEQYANILLNEYYGIYLNNKEKLIPVGVFVVKSNNNDYNILCVEKFFAEYDLYANFYSRMEAEQKELSCRIAKLSETINNYEKRQAIINSSGEECIKLMQAQLSIMMEYNSALIDRLKVECGKKIKNITPEQNKTFIKFLLDELWLYASNDSTQKNLENDFMLYYNMLIQAYKKYLGVKTKFNKSINRVEIV